MKIYNYDENGIFLNECEAELDPAEWQLNHKKVYLVPAFSTKIKPPKTKENQTTRFNGKNWDVVIDYRGQYICDELLNIIEVQEVGELPEGYITITAEQAAEISEDNLKYIVDNGELILNPHYEEDKQAKEREQLGQLTLTRDNPLIDAIGKMLGYSSEDLDNLFKNKNLPQKEEENE